MSALFPVASDRPSIAWHRQLGRATHPIRMLSMRRLAAKTLAASLGLTLAVATAAEALPGANQEVFMSDQSLPLPSADRGAPPAVAPVVSQGVRYEQNLRATEAEFGQVGGVLSARDARSGTLLWSMKVYSNVRQAGLEGDVQDVFFRSMAFDEQGRLVIENERGARFAVDVAQRTVTALP